MDKKNIKNILLLAVIVIATCGWHKYQGSEEAETTEVSQNPNSKDAEEAQNSKDAEEAQNAQASSSEEDALNPPSPSLQKGESYEVPRWSNAHPQEQLLQRMAYTTSYNKNTRNPNWVGWVLTANHTDGNYERKGQKFLEDQDVPAPRALYSDIREGECGYQRGHMCPAGDNKWSYKALKESFLMTNICPQNGNLNQQDWKYLELACKDWAKRYGKIYIVAGPIFNKGKRKTVGENQVAVPNAFFKVILRTGKTASDTQAIGFIYANKAGNHDMSYYVRSVDEVEKATGLDFFYQLDDKIEEKVESQSNLSKW